MDNKTLLNQLGSLIEPIAEDLDYELYYIEYIKESGEYYLRVYIDSDKGISLSDCEKVSRSVSDALDENDPIKDPYYLEVSSPGIERGLYNEKHLARYTGSDVTLKLTKLFEGKRILNGKLLGFDEDSVTIQAEKSDVAVPRDIIKSINLQIKF
ncbi:MAG: ribosome maturation factor RimP [Clostridiaceae bacterium]